MCPVVVLTRSDDTTAAPVIQRLRAIGADVEIVDPASLLLNGGFEWVLADCMCLPTVWYRRPTAMVDVSIHDAGISLFAEAERVAAMTALFSEVPEERWWNHPCRIAAAARKPVQLRIAKQLGLTVPRTMITNSETSARRFLREIGGVAAMKPLASFSAVVHGEKKAMFTTKVREDDILDGVFARIPHFLQEYIEKECEYRVTLIGSEAFVARIDSQTVSAAQIDWRRDAYYNSPMKQDVLPEEVLSRLHALKNHFGLNWGAVDLIKNPRGEYVFLEINPNGQWLWVEESTGMPLTEAFVRSLSSNV